MFEQIHTFMIQVQIISYIFNFDFQRASIFPVSVKLYLAWLRNKTAKLLTCEDKDGVNLNLYKQHVRQQLCMGLTFRNVLTKTEAHKALKFESL